VLSAGDGIALAYSGGLDTSVIIHWLKDRLDMDVIALTADVGNQRNLDEIRERALRIGAVKAVVPAAEMVARLQREYAQARRRLVI